MAAIGAAAGRTVRVPGLVGSVPMPILMLVAILSAAGFTASVLNLCRGKADRRRERPWVRFDRRFAPVLTFPGGIQGTWR